MRRVLSSIFKLFGTADELKNERIYQHRSPESVQSPYVLLRISSAMNSEEMETFGGTPKNQNEMVVNVQCRSKNTASMDVLDLTTKVIAFIDGQTQNKFIDGMSINIHRGPMQDVSVEDEDIYVIQCTINVEENR